MSSSEVKRFLELSIKYRKHFLLTLQDLDTLLMPFGLIYTGVESGKRTLTLALTEGIAKVYGLSYCQIITPNNSIPKIDDLPTQTKARVLERESEGKKMRNEELALPRHVWYIMKSTKLPKEFTSSDIWKLLPLDIQGQVKSIRITDLFKKGELKDKVQDTGEKRGREKLYKLK